MVGGAARNAEARGGQRARVSKARFRSGLSLWPEASLKMCCQRRHLADGIQSNAFGLAVLSRVGTRHVWDVAMCRLLRLLRRDMRRENHFLATLAGIDSHDFNNVCDERIQFQ